MRKSKARPRASGDGPNSNRTEHLGLYNCIRRADLYTLRCIKVAFTLDANVGVDLIVLFTLADCVDGSFFLARATGDAFIRDLHCHVVHLLSSSGF